MKTRTRDELHEILCNILGSRNVYFQPPESLKLKYPCIVYERSYIRMIRADNGIHKASNEYTVTIIDEDPDSEVPAKMLTLSYCRFDRHFVSDNLNHDVFRLYY